MKVPHGSPNVRWISGRKGADTPGAPLYSYASSVFPSLAHLVNLMEFVVFEIVFSSSLFGRAVVRLRIQHFWYCLEDLSIAMNH